MIYIPNERRELWVLKVDQDGKPLKEAKFGLYDNERCDGTPVASGVTDDKGMLIFSPTGQENGTGHTKMDWADSSTETRYYLQEIRAPEGYTQNTTKIPLVWDVDHGAEIPVELVHLEEFIAGRSCMSQCRVALLSIAAFKP